MVSQLDALDGMPWMFRHVEEKTKPFVSETLSDPTIWACLKERMVPLEGGNTFHFDSRGDLTLNVGDSEKEGSFMYRLVVCSRSLARWSSVFRAMLFSGFAESKPSDSSPWTIKMPEDNISAVFIVLSIVHSHFQHIPKSLEQDELYQLLAITEKYDMTQVLNPWASAWFKPCVDKSISSTEGNEVIMWISWELGHEETFSRYAIDLLRTSRVDGEGHLIDSDGIALNTYVFLEPPGILESIAQTRKSAIEKITSVLYKEIQDTLKRDRCTSKMRHDPYSNCKMQPDQCIKLVLGALIHHVNQIGLEDVALLRAATPNYTGSINELLAAIEGIDFNIHDRSRHVYCDPFPHVKERVRGIVKKLGSPVTALHLEYLRSQAKKTGV